MVYELQCDPIVEGTMLFLAIMAILLEQFAHYLVGILQLIRRYGIRCDLIAASNIALVLHH